MGVSRQLKCLAHNMYAAHKKRMKERLRENPSSSFRFVHSLFFFLSLCFKLDIHVTRESVHIQISFNFFISCGLFCVCASVFFLFSLFLRLTSYLVLTFQIYVKKGIFFKFFFGNPPALRVCSVWASSVPVSKDMRR